MERKPTYAELIAAGVSREEAQRVIEGYRQQVIPVSAERKIPEPWQTEVERLFYMRRSREKILEEVAAHYPNAPIGAVVDYLNKLYIVGER